MCCPHREMPTNQNGQATRLWLCHCQSIQIRVFHITWFAFWLCFFGWFITANLWDQIEADLGLNKQLRAIAGGCSVASTVIFRVIVGWFCDRIGPKKTYFWLLIASSIPIAGMALVQDNIGFVIDSLFIGIAGAAFVITQYHTTAMFAGKTVGTANATSAGWGNFGGGCANFFMPELHTHFVKTYDLDSSTAWRICMIVPALIYVVYAFIYWFFTVDRPPKPDNSGKHSLFILKNDSNESSGTTEKKQNASFKAAAFDLRTWILAFIYSASFGIELTVLRFAAGYFQREFGVEQRTAGFIVLCFSFCNLFARSLGGIIADMASKYAAKSLRGRVYSLFIVELLQGIFLILFSFGDNLIYTISMMIMFSLFAQAAEGGVFAIVPFVRPNSIGPVTGIVGAGGNVGAVVAAFVLFANVPGDLSYSNAWFILGIFVFVVSFSALGIRFNDQEINDADEIMGTFDFTELNNSYNSDNIAVTDLTTQDVREKQRNQQWRELSFYS